MNAIGPVAIALTVALGLVAGGCVDDDRAFRIRQNQVPGSGCEVGTSTTKFQAAGLLDVSVNFGYRFFPLIENNMRSTKGDGQPERNQLYLRKVKISLDLDEIPGNYPDDLVEFGLPISGLLNPGARIVIGGIEIVRAELVQMLPNLETRRPYIMASVGVIADRNGEEVESGSFLYPIELCEGCLVDYRASCPTSGDTTVIRNVCGLPQESRVTCCNDPATNNTTCYSK